MLETFKKNFENAKEIGLLEGVTYEFFLEFYNDFGVTKEFLQTKEAQNFLKSQGIKFPRKKRVSYEIQFNLVKDSVDFLVSIGDWDLSIENINKHIKNPELCGKKIFEATLYPQVRLYIEKARDKVNYYEFSEKKRRYSIETLEDMVKQKENKKNLNKSKVTRSESSATNPSKRNKKGHFINVLIEAIEFLETNNYVVCAKNLNTYILNKTGELPYVGCYNKSPYKSIYEEAKKRTSNKKNLKPILVFEKEEINNNLVIESKNSSTISINQFLVNYTKDVIDICAKSANDKITINQIVNMIPSNLNLPITIEFISSNEEIIVYLNEVNSNLDEKICIKKIRDCYEKLVEQNENPNRYTLLAVCNFLDYEYLNNHNKVLEVIECLF